MKRISIRELREDLEAAIDTLTEREESLYESDNPQVIKMATKVMATKEALQAVLDYTYNNKIYLRMLSE